MADQAIGVFVEASFPGVIRLSEIDVGLELLGQALVAGELTTVVGSEGVDACLMRA